ncbi:hypothetical protein WMF28_37730 [Sorangium sp. So ce590]
MIPATTPPSPQASDGLPAVSLVTVGASLDETAALRPVVRAASAASAVSGPTTPTSRIAPTRRSPGPSRGAAVSATASRCAPGCSGSRVTWRWTCCAAVALIGAGALVATRLAGLLRPKARSEGAAGPYRTSP